MKKEEAPHREPWEHTSVSHEMSGLDYIPCSILTGKGACVWEKGVRLSGEDRLDKGILSWSQIPDPHQAQLTCYNKRLTGLGRKCATQKISGASSKTRCTALGNEKFYIEMQKDSHLRSLPIQPWRKSTHTLNTVFRSACPYISKQKAVSFLKAQPKHVQYNYQVSTKSVQS